MDIEFSQVSNEKITKTKLNFFFIHHCLYKFGSLSLKSHHYHVFSNFECRIF